MAMTTCLKCSGHSFEIVPFNPIGTQQKLSFVQCADCGTAVGVIDPTLCAAISAVRNQVAAIDDGLRRIANAL
jgi:hypothetical protein